MSTSSFRRRLAIAGIGAMAMGTQVTAQQPTGRLTYALPPSTWRLTVTAEGMPAADVRSTPDRPALHARDIAAARLTVRLGAPAWKRGLYRTVVANEVAIERFSFAHGDLVSLGRPDAARILSTGPSGLNSLQHDLLVSQAIGARWRISGVLQHGFFSIGTPSLGSYQAAGGVFVSRVYRPTLQVGVGAVALNVTPWWIPTLRLVHVGQRWRSDVLLPRAETWYDVGRGVEVGATLRFTGNAWQRPPNTVPDQVLFTDIGRTTWTQGTIGPAMNVRVGARGLLNLETGVAQRRMVVEGITAGPGINSTQYLRSRLDQGLSAFVRTAFRASF